MQKTYSFSAVFLVFLFGLFAAACQHGAQDPSDGLVLPESAIQHLVVVWLKESGNEEARQKVIEATYGFEQIPGVLSVSVGPPKLSGREVVDDSFDVALVITFADEEAYNEYLPHPLHRQAVEEVIRPLVDRFVVYDFHPAR
ncbi:MAG: Dabb family protein [Opitutales bacterium]|nr:Dabb family protein [Opitutales bacterium]MCH8540573.1 Dabb family protein [Opitutales bacterium]